VELRIAERKSKEDKEHMKYLRQLAKEEREKREAIAEIQERLYDEMEDMEEMFTAKLDLRDQFISDVQETLTKVDRDQVWLYDHRLLLVVCSTSVCAT